MSITTYILNRSPTKRLDGITPEEAWEGDKPTVIHLNLFGSLCYRHVLGDNRNKLDDMDKPMLMVGYHVT